MQMQLSRSITAVTLIAALAAGAAIAGMPEDPPDRISAGRVVPAETAQVMPPTLPTTTVAATTTTSTTTTTTTLAPTTTVALDDRSSIVIVVANGTGVESVAGVFRDRIRPLGYTQVYATATKQDVVGSTIYCLPGFEDEALRLATEVGFTPEQVVPITAPTEAPAYWLSREFQILVVIGKKS